MTATVLASSSAADEFPALRPVTLHVRNTALIPGTPLSGAMREVVRLYSDIGVTLTWEEHDATSTYLTYDAHAADLLFQVISRRYEQKSIVITTNAPFKQWDTVFRTRRAPSP